MQVGREMHADAFKWNAKYEEWMMDGGRDAGGKGGYIADAFLESLL